MASPAGVATEWIGMRPIGLSFVLALTTAALQAQQPSRGVLHVSARIQGSMKIVFATDWNGQPSVFTGLDSTSFSVPVMETFFRSPVSPSAGEATFRAAMPFTIRVINANMPSFSYTLSARLRAPDPARTWAIDGIEITDAEHSVGSAGTYGASQPHMLQVSGLSEGMTQSLANAIQFQVTAN